MSTPPEPPPPTPIERYSLTSCDLVRTFPSLRGGDASYAGALRSPRPELLRCDRAAGVSVALQTGVGNITSTIPPDNWTQAPLLESEWTLSRLQQHLSGSSTATTAATAPTTPNPPTGFSVAAWFTPTPTRRAILQPILTIGGTVPYTPTPGNYSSYTAHCRGYDLTILQFQKTVYVSYTDGDDARSCRFVRAAGGVDLTAAIVPTHVTATFGPHYTNVYLNGRLAVDGAPNDFDPALRHWNLTAATLQLFTAHSTDKMFLGAIQQVDLYDQYLDAAQAVAVYEQGIIDVPPSQITVAAQTNEIRVQQHATDPVPLTVGSWNTTSAVLKLEVELLTLPQHGVLTSSDVSAGSRGVAPKSRFPIAPGASSVPFHYQLSPSSSTDYFNVPAVNAYNASLAALGEPESFRFRIVAYDANATRIAASPPVTQFVRVVHVNHPGVLSAPVDAVRDAVDPTWAAVTNDDSDGTSMIRYADPLDYDMDRVRVDLWTNHGRVVLRSGGAAASNMMTVEEDWCRHRVGSWQCTGGSSDVSGLLTFVAIPYDIPFILRNLGYQGASAAAADEITIRVSDGAGGTCLDEAEHAQWQSGGPGGVFPSVRDGCFQTQVRVRVPAYTAVGPEGPTNATHIHGGGGGNNGGGLFGSGILSTADVLFWLLVFAMVAAIASCVRRVPRCLARGKAVDADNDDDGDAAASAKSSEASPAVAEAV